MFEAGEEDGVVFVAMKLAPGGDLGSLIRHERLADVLPRSSARSRPPSMAHTLTASSTGTSSQGNVLLDEVREREHAYIADFGVDTGRVPGRRRGQ